MAWSLVGVGARWGREGWRGEEGEDKREALGAESERKRKREGIEEEERGCMEDGGEEGGGGEGSIRKVSKVR